MEPVIRAAEVRDARAVTSIYVESSNEGFGTLSPPRQYSVERVAGWERELSAGLPHRWWVVELDATVVAFAGIGPSRDPVDATLGELDTIAVHPDHWRRGIGKALMVVALEFLAADGYRAAVVWTLAGYERGRAFYEATGWTLDGGVRDDGRQVRYRRLLNT
jgi:GNAT superfamily N-acetyltransferase